MQPYPAITQTDPMQQLLGQVMGGYKPNQLGAGVTLGNPEAQQDYVAQLAQALADGGSASDLMARAQGLQDSGWIDNSGIAGVAERIVSAYAGKKMSEKARAQQADAEQRRMNAEFELEDRKALRDAERSEKLTTRERTRRQSLAQQMGLNNREAVEFIETGKVPNAVRGVPMMTDQGLVNVNPYTNEYEQVQPQGQQRSQPQTPFQIEGDVPPQVRAAIQADPAAWESGQQIDIPPPKQPLMPYVDPAVAQQREASNRRADEAAARADRAEARAERDLQFRQEQARAKPKPGRTLGAEAANKVGLYDNAIRSANEWFALVAEKDEQGNFTGGYNNVAAMSPRAKSLYKNAVRAKLRAESGASIPEGEEAGEMERYGPRAFGGDATDLGNATNLLRDLVQQRKLLTGSGEDAGGFSVGQIIEKAGKKYRVVGGDPNDPDVEEVR